MLIVDPTHGPVVNQTSAAGADREPRGLFFEFSNAGVSYIVSLQLVIEERLLQPPSPQELSASELMSMENQLRFEGEEIPAANSLIQVVTRDDVTR